MIREWFQGKKTEGAKQEIETQILPFAVAIEQTINDPKVERVVHAYLTFRDQMNFGGGSPQDDPLLNEKISAVYQTLAELGITLEEVKTSYGTDDTLHRFVDGYTQALAEDIQKVA